MNLFKKLVRFKVNPGERISAQIGDFRWIDYLKSIGVELNEDFVAVLLLYALLEEMESFVVAVESRDELPGIDLLVSKVLEEERRQRDKNNYNGVRVFSASQKHKHEQNKTTINPTERIIV